MRATISLFLLLLLAGCAQYQARAELAAQSQKMNSALAPYVGKSIADFVVNRGAPTSTIDLDHSHRMFSWTITGTRAGVVIPVGGIIVSRPPTEISCTVTFVAEGTTKNPSLRDWTILNYRWNGAC